MSLSQITLPTGKSNIPIYEFPIAGTTGINYLYNENGIEINYGYDSNGRYRVAYGALLDNNHSEFAFGGKDYSAGLHSIKLGRRLTVGEEINLVWHDGHRLVIYEENGTTKVKKRNGGSYNEIGKWINEDGSSEHTALYFNDDLNTKRFDKIEIKSFEEF